MGGWGDGGMGRWGDGEMGRWGDGERCFLIFESWQTCSAISIMNLAKEGISTPPSEGRIASQ